MENYSIEIYSSRQSYSAPDEFEEALRYREMRYSMRHMILAGTVTSQDLLKAIQKCLQICQLVGVNSNDHFKPLYIYDSNAGVTYTDWLMSKMGFNLMMMQLPLNEQTARWILELADV